MLSLEICSPSLLRVYIFEAHVNLLWKWCFIDAKTKSYFG